MVVLLTSKYKEDPFKNEGARVLTRFPHYSPMGAISLRERLRTHNVFTKDQRFYLNYHKFSIKSYVLDVY